MGGAPFHLEIEAYSRLTGAEPDAWEVSMLRALYRLNMKVLDGKAKNPSAPTTDARDGAGVAGMLRGMGAKKG